MFQNEDLTAQREGDSQKVLKWFGEEMPLKDSIRRNAHAL